MAKKAPKRWWSWNPTFPKPAIVALHILTHLTIIGAWLYGIYIRGEATFNKPILAWDGIINANPIANLTAILILSQLNFAVFYTIPTSLCNEWEKEQAVAKATAAAAGQTAAAQAEAAEARAQIAQAQAEATQAQAQAATAAADARVQAAEIRIQAAQDQTAAQAWY